MHERGLPTRLWPGWRSSVPCAPGRASQGEPRVNDSVGTLPSGPGVKESWPYRKHDPRPGVPPDPPIARAVVDSARARRLRAGVSPWSRSRSAE
jgi:hypothetical protein